MATPLFATAHHINYVVERLHALVRDYRASWVMPVILLHRYDPTGHRKRSMKQKYHHESYAAYRQSAHVVKAFRYRLGRNTRTGIEHTCIQAAIIIIDTRRSTTIFAYSVGCSACREISTIMMLQSYKFATEVLNYGLQNTSISRPSIPDMYNAYRR